MDSGVDGLARGYLVERATGYSTSTCISTGSIVRRRGAPYCTGRFAFWLRVRITCVLFLAHLDFYYALMMMKIYINIIFVLYIIIVVLSNLSIF